MSNLMSNISTLQSTLTRRRQASTLNVQLAKAEKESTTGLRADVFRDLGHRAAEGLNLRTQTERTQAYVTSNKLLEGKLEVTALTMSNIRGISNDYLALAIGSRDSKGALAGELQASALAALDQIISHANIQYKGSAVFGGIEGSTAPLQGWQSAHAATGYSPMGVIAGIVGAGPVDATDAAAMVAEIVSVFDNTHPDANLHFESTFYNGAPALTGGVPTERVTARIDEGVTLDYGIQANDPAFTEVIRGLAMLAAIDVSQIADEDAYAAYVTDAVDAISRGTDGLLQAESWLGGRQKVVGDAIESQEALLNVYNSRLLDLEGVDPYEAATRVSQFETQLNSSYAVTARLMNLSLLNFLS